MESAYLFFQQNIIVVYFIYGLVFFLMGFAITLQNEKPSSLILSRSFNYLAAFGITHGISEWGHVFIPIMEGYASEGTLGMLNFIETVLIGGSFVFLFYFGLKLYTDTIGLPQWVLWVPRISGILWLAIFVLLPHFLQRSDITYWYRLGDVASRYGFAFPGAILSARAIWQQREDLFSLGQPQVLRTLRWTAIMFVFYAVFAGLIVPSAPFFPATYINNENLFRATGFPVAVYRAILCSAIAYFVIQLTAVFNLENRQQLAQARQEYAILQERQRIRRDLHDGILQGIYAVGLSLDTARHLAVTDPAASAEIITRENQRLDSINQEIRRYIMDIRDITFQEYSLKQILLGMLEEFKLNSTIAVVVQIEDTRHEKLNIIQKEQIHLIVTEILSNILRHSKAKNVAVSLTYPNEHLELVIADDGVGLIPKNKHSGIQNILERTALIGGNYTIDSFKNKGTKVKLTVPLLQHK
jgi:signal transduction histidine kinase